LTVRPRVPCTAPLLLAPQPLLVTCLVGLRRPRACVCGPAGLWDGAGGGAHNWAALDLGMALQQ
jgi:hypothetical protein